MTLHDGRLVTAPVIRVRRREASRLLAVAFEGGTLRVTGEHSLRVGAPHSYLAGGVLVHNY
jgi:hypothetical protein